MKTPVWLLALVLLAGCAASASQVVIDPQSSQLRVQIRASSVMLRDISLPAYAEASEITIRAADGTLTEQKGQVWADDPTRAMTGAMVRNLSVITGAQIAAEPWPLDGYPDVEVTIRVEHMFVRDDGSVTLSGYYAIRRDTGRNRIQQFDIALPTSVPGTAAFVPAFEAAWIQLAEQIARAL